MSTVDLEALERELKKAGFEANVYYDDEYMRTDLSIRFRDHHRKASMQRLTVHEDGSISGRLGDRVNSPIFDALDIIRRHLDPPVARPELRERVRIAIAASGIGDTADAFVNLDSATDAVLAALSEVDHG